MALVLTISVLSTSCRFHGNYVNFDDLGEAENLFRVTSRADIEMGDSLREVLIERVAEALREEDAPQSTGRQDVSSVTSTAIVQNLLEWDGNVLLTQMSGIYKSVDVDMETPITLSGKVIFPKYKKIRNIILISHYTIGSNAESPSNSFPLESILARQGYAVVVPDYLGYGVTADRVHPYLAMNLTARNVLDMYLAVKPFLKAAGVKIESDSIYLMGYSQGGATTMAVQHLIEKDYNLNYPENSIKIQRVFAGGGPYDVVSTFDKFVITGHASYPCAVPMVIQGMIEAAGLKTPIDSFATPLVTEHLDEWFNSKRYTTSQMNTLLGTYKTADLMSEQGRDRNSRAVANLYKAMYANSIVNVQDGWEPIAPVYMMHSIDDETVDYINAQKAKSAWKNSNIEYNFGHYGGHVKTCVRFIFTVKELLK